MLALSFWLLNHLGVRRCAAVDSTFSVICWLRAEELSPGWAENRKIAAMMANVTHSITARTSFSLLFCSGIPVPPRSIVPSCTIHMAYLKSIPVLRCRIKRKNCFAITSDTGTFNIYPSFSRCRTCKASDSYPALFLRLYSKV